jgi:hypothetical protein
VRRERALRPFNNPWADRESASQGASEPGVRHGVSCAPGEAPRAYEEASRGRLQNDRIVKVDAWEECRAMRVGKSS